MLPDEQRQEVVWARRSLVATGMHRSDRSALIQILDNLRSDIHELRRVNIVYRSSGHSEVHLRALDPYTLVYRWGWYVIGYCHLRQQVRTFRVDRIIELSITSLVYQIQPDFDIHAYLADELKDQPKVLVRLRFAPQVACVALGNRAFWETYAEQSDGSVDVTFSTPDLNWAASSAIAYGPMVLVLEPPELRQILHEWALLIANHYQSS